MTHSFCVRGLRAFVQFSLGFAAVSTPLVAQAKSEPDRPTPDYDGREGKGHPTTVGQAALWVPRVALFPAFVVSEYLLRRPLGYAITAAEKADLPAALYDFFAFGPDHKAGVVPVGFIDFGFRPSVGLYAFWDDAGMKGHALRLRGSTGGAGWLAGALTENFQISSTASIGWSGSLTRRPDYTFYGLGSDTRESERSRYAADTAQAQLDFRTTYWRSSVLDTSLGYRGVSFGPGRYGKDPSLPLQVDRGAFVVPDGYASGYRAPFVDSTLTLDTRRLEDSSESGARVALSAEEGGDLSRSTPASWLRYGASVGGFWDLGNRGRVLSLSVAAEFSDPLGSRPIPFTELVTLGGNDKMPGFRMGRLRGRSSGVATLRYAWPIWIWLDGSMQAAIGNVFNEHLSGASWGESRFSGAIGVESRGSRDSVFQLLVGFGTETFNSGADVNSIRLVAGARSGF
ncbi:MAG: hypothetical protein ABIQ16_06220 [Polyangiaceae bacterium]